MHSKQNLTVVIPLYNKRDYIRRSVESVLNQTHRDFELIVIDDGSTDDSLEQLYGIKDERLRIESQANAGEGATRNRGAALANNAWVAYLDADDAWAPGFLAAVTDMIACYPSSALCATGYYIRSPQGVKLVGDIGANQARLHNNYFAVAYQGKLPFCASSVAIRRDALVAVGGFAENEPLGADQDLWCRLLTHHEFALNRYPHATYHEDAQNRVCVASLPTAELPFSQRVQRQLDDDLIPNEQRLDAKRYIAAHLLHLATLNYSQKRWAIASALISDTRTGALPRKKCMKWIHFQVLRLQDWWVSSRKPAGVFQW